MAPKVCPVVFRVSGRGADLLAFRHPLAGNQFVKGTIEENELAQHAAIRELREESGITIDGHDLLDLGHARIGEHSIVWHFFAARVEGLPQCWEYRTEDDLGHTFSFFWHRLTDELGEDWHPQYHEVLRVVRRLLPI